MENCVQNTSSSFVEQNFRNQSKRKRKAVISSSDEDNYEQNFRNQSKRKRKAVISSSDDHNYEQNFHNQSKRKRKEVISSLDDHNNNYEQNFHNQSKTKQKAVISSSDDHNNNYEQNFCNQLKRKRKAVISSSEDDHNENYEQNFRNQSKRKRKAVISFTDDDGDNYEISSLRLGDHDDIDDSSSSSVEQNPRDQLKITHAQPLIRRVWTGTFNVFCDESIYHRRVYSFNGFLSSKASEKQRDLAGEMEAELLMEMVPKPYMWPRRFREWGPSDADIAVYFFPPSKEHESLYDWLIAEMIECDLGMRRVMEQDKKQPDMRIFTSHDLPFKFQKIQGKFFLWGTFL